MKTYRIYTVWNESWLPEWTGESGGYVIESWEADTPITLEELRGRYPGTLAVLYEETRKKVKTRGRRKHAHYECTVRRIGVIPDNE